MSPFPKGAPEPGKVPMVCLHWEKASRGGAFASPSSPPPKKKKEKKIDSFLYWI